MKLGVTWINDLCVCVRADLYKGLGRCCYNVMMFANSTRRIILPSSVHRWWSYLSYKDAKIIFWDENLYDAQTCIRMCVDRTLRDMFRKWHNCLGWGGLFGQVLPVVAQEYLMHKLLGLHVSIKSRLWSSATNISFDYKWAH